MRITCPSGLTFDARGWKLGDRKVLMDISRGRRGTTQVDMLNLVAGPVESPGPYPGEIGAKINWSEVVLPDISSALFDVRIQTKDEFEFDVNCPSCGVKLEMSVVLSKFTRLPMTEEAKACISQNTLDIYEVPEQDLILHLRMLRGRDLPTLATGGRGDQALTLEIQQCLHVVELHRAGMALKEQRDIRKFYQEADYRFHRALTERIDSYGGGVDTSVLQTCRVCDREVEIYLPLDSSFYDPSQEPRRKQPSTSV